MNRIGRQQLKNLIVSATGVSAVGVASVRPVDEEAVAMYRRWTNGGRHAEMNYLEKHDDVRRHPGLLLEGAKTIVMAAFSFANPEGVRRMEETDTPRIAEYALGLDYHEVIRRRMIGAGEVLTAEYGGMVRVCVDTAPLRERYWAQQAGIGFIGVNNYLIIPGQGAHFCLGALLWTGEPADGYDEACTSDCGRCGRCVAACPTGALQDDGSLDARKCLSYLTIESREPLPSGIAVGKRIFGCDTCRRVCPHEPVNPPQTDIVEMRALDEVLSLDRDAWENMTEQRFKEIFRHSAVRRAKLSKLKDTLSHIS